MTETEAWAAQLPPHEGSKSMVNIDTSTEAVERLLDGVTPGPWTEHDAGKHPHVFVCGPDELYYNGEVEDKPLVAYVTGVGAIENRAFIAAARNLVPALVKERDEALARVRALEEITDPDFIWGAMDNVHDMDVTMDDYAKAVSRAQRAALSDIEPASVTLDAALQVPEVWALVEAATKARIILAEFEPHPLPVLGELLAALAALKETTK